ncbi:hypothetical protein J41TS12_12730 [Paenibacillus antibioticophila]|uniref:Uncharacterized protein n=1 Tax=Paenibacillus antibioticophila TaxID=1274374 RepID=A0A919XTJ1_9BACL|nr:hypothetical protein [Paenibacillus antibioticophila]GIO36412.1 hypothetical protein J41TS12_12730 [Paenibacillus antibioticophila]
MKHKTKIILEQEVLSVDIHEIAERYDNQRDLDECMQMIQKELNLIRRRPGVEGKLCEYEPLKSAGFRKVKLYSSKVLEAARGEKPDLRIIYRYSEEENTVRIESIGFRLKTRPRPDNDPYSRAERRLTEKY